MLAEVEVFLFELVSAIGHLKLILFIASFVDVYVESVLFFSHESNHINHSPENRLRGSTLGIDSDTLRSVDSADLDSITGLDLVDHGVSHDYLHSLRGLAFRYSLRSFLQFDCLS